MDTSYPSRMVDRQVGRNAELFASSIARLSTPEERYPYLRILVSIIEQAHPEWVAAPHKVRQISALVHSMDGGSAISEEEIAHAVRRRDAERNGLRDGARDGR